MKVHLRAYGIAADILKSRKIEIGIDPESTIEDVKNYLMGEYDDFSKLKSLSFAIGEEYVDDRVVLNEGDVIVIIPPVSGG